MAKDRINTHTPSFFSRKKNSDSYPKSFLEEVDKNRLSFLLDKFPCNVSRVAV